MSQPVCYLVTNYAANNDVNGNPRRVYVFREVTVYEDDEDRAVYYGTEGYASVVFTQDEGYDGFRPAVEQFRRRGYAGPLVDLGRVDTTVAEYKRLVKWSADD